MAAKSSHSAPGSWCPSSTTPDANDSIIAFDFRRERQERTQRNSIVLNGESGANRCFPLNVEVGLRSSCFCFPSRTFASFALNALVVGHRQAIPSSFRLHPCRFSAHSTCPLPFSVYSVAK